MTKNPLIGQTIKEIYITSDREAIKFVLDGGAEVVARCDGDCCSYTWIEDVIDPQAAIGSPVLNVVDLNLPEESQTPTKTDNSEEEMEYYGCGIETNKGRFTIAYRNSSNGYYGGSLTWPGEYFYGGVYGQNSHNDDWQPIQGN